MKEELASKEPKLVNRSRLQGNARPHTVQQTAGKLEELQLEFLRHPRYASGFAPTDYDFYLKFG